MTLSGRRIMVTRPADEAEELAEALRAQGAGVVVAPTIEIRPVEGEALERLDAAARDVADGRFAWVVFTSVRAVDAVLGRLAAQGYGPFPSAVRASLAAVGDATAARLADAGLPVDLVPARFTTEELASSFPAGAGAVLTPRADIAPDLLEPLLAAKGWSPARVDAYRTDFPDALPDHAVEALRTGGVDAVTFTSASTVRGFRHAWPGELPPHVKVVCIGPVTADEARAHGLPVDAEADPHTVEGLVAAVGRALA